MTLDYTVEDKKGNKVQFLFDSHTNDLRILMFETGKGTSEVASAGVTLNGIAIIHLCNFMNLTRNVPTTSF